MGADPARRDPGGADAPALFAGRRRRALSPEVVDPSVLVPELVAPAGPDPVALVRCPRRGSAERHRPAPAGVPTPRGRSGSGQRGARRAPGLRLPAGPAAAARVPGRAAKPRHDRGAHGVRLLDGAVRLRRCGMGVVPGRCGEGGSPPGCRDPEGARGGIPDSASLDGGAFLRGAAPDRSGVAAPRAQRASSGRFAERGVHAAPRQPSHRRRLEKRRRRRGAHGRNGILDPSSRRPIHRAVRNRRLHENRRFRK